MSGTRAPAQFFAHSFDFYECRCTSRIHLFQAGSEQQVHALSLQELAVLLQIARVARKIFIRTELRWVHEYGCRHHVALPTSGADERQMPFVQRAHGGNKAQAMLVGASVPAGDAHLVGALDQLEFNRRHRHLG